MIGKSKKYNFVIFAADYSWYTYMFQEVQGRSDVKYCSSINDIFSSLERKLYWHGNEKVKKWVYRRALKRISFDNDNEICFVHFSVYLPYMRGGLLEAEKAVFHDCKRVHYFTDVKHMTEENMSFLREAVDDMGAFDPTIAAKYKIKFWSNVFPNLKIENDDVEYDISFVGGGVEREQLLEKIAEHCAKNGLKAAFYVQNNDICEKSKYITYITERMPYSSAVEVTRKSRCVLELSRESKQKSCSMRVIEAVVLNKKILTDNANVFNMPCCKEHQQNIQCFQRFEDIDWGFLKDDKVCNYEYGGVYSLEKLLDDITGAIQADIR
jgi:hypothetical protein